MTKQRLTFTVAFSRVLFLMIIGDRYLGFAYGKSFGRGRSQNSEFRIGEFPTECSANRRNENYRRGSQKNLPLVFFPYLAENPRFLNHYHLKASILLVPKKAKTFICKEFDI
ncbi:MAG: hypothetical protein F6K54_33085 [Okeania sp. SIO3B5]|uniref:hypothetical protein n=1 Tax=Okeania sp. SIO3B5 TaxID=2607811 RepID=UPI0013FF2879|nr:hypothetical protein [Okeania sp. SIO3B5]NEO57486.1 hypothetical protein [Okeania sp. SIO3B5]